VILEKHAEILLKQFSQEKQVIKRVQQFIIKFLPKGNLDLLLASHELSMSRSTLYRKLKEKGPTFMQLGRRIRQDLAYNSLVLLHFKLNFCEFCVFLFTQLNPLLALFNRGGLSILYTHVREVDGNGKEQVGDPTVQSP